MEFRSATNLMYEEGVLNPTEAPRRVQSLVRVLSATVVVLSCHDPTASSRPALELGVHFGKPAFFEGEPLYIVFELSNKGPDTAFIAPFQLTAWYLRADLRNSEGDVLPEWGPVADYAFPPGYRGAPLAPGERLFGIALLQDRWGKYQTAATNLYLGHHIPPGEYEFRARFSFGLREVGFIEAGTISFAINPRTAAEDTAFQTVQELAAMPWDSAARPSFLAALIASVESRDAGDPFVPFLAGPFVGVARGVGYPPDSAATDRLAEANLAAADAQRYSPAGAMAVAAVYSMRPQRMAALVEQLRGSLAGDVALSMLNR